MEQSSPLCSVLNFVRLIVACGLLSFLLVHNAALESLAGVDDDNYSYDGEGDLPRIRGQPKAEPWKERRVVLDNESRLERIDVNIDPDSNIIVNNNNNSTSDTNSLKAIQNTQQQLKVQLWDDGTPFGVREAILEKEAWLEYNGKPLGDPDDALTKPMFEVTQNSSEADIIVWVTVKGRHDEELAPMDPIKHAPEKAVILDYSDGGVVHMKRKWMIGNETELAYFKRSFIKHGENNSYKKNTTSPKSGILPYAYSGSRAMMIPPGIPEADRNHEPIFGNTPMIYGKIAAMSSRTTDTNKDDGYFKDRRYQNFLIPYQERLWNIVNVIRYIPTGPNNSRNNVVEWTREFSQNMAGDPRTVKVIKNEMSKLPKPNETIHDHSFKAYVGEIDNFCKPGVRRCFGPNYFRLLRDAKIIVTCNPSAWEGDFRLYEAFLSGAMVMVDKMFILEWMPNTPIDGTHWVTYDPGNKTDFMDKLSYYTDPANSKEAETIAKNGYEFVLRNHMTVNRVDYILNHDTVKNKLMKNVQDPAKREIFGFPPLQ